ncbi:outer membrane efflux protein [Oxalobacteraceae bacterium IMCC9480]|nr:outer membrane efflux protein [Oxalobacteraceae bacterium IMCC9480]
MKAALWLALVAFGAPVLAQSVLPPEQVVRNTLENLPQVRASAMNIDLARAGKARLDAGTHEWTVRTGLSRRTDQIGGRYNEQDVALERAVRWFGKAAKDRAIGDKGIDVAVSGHEDAWHEAGRSLLTDWFGALREMSATLRLEEQVALAGQLRAIAEKRVKAGDAAKAGAAASRHRKCPRRRPAATSAIASRAGPATAGDHLPGLAGTAGDQLAATGGHDRIGRLVA